MSRCPICLEPLTKSVAYPDSCDHAFCLECLQKWSKHQNICPVDRNKFKKIVTTEQIIQVKPLKRRKERTLYDITRHCEVCNLSEEEAVGILILCDYCDLSFHLHCLTPRLQFIPPDEWLCPTCDMIVQNTAKKRPNPKEEIDVLSRHLNLTRPAAEVVVLPNVSKLVPSGDEQTGKDVAKKTLVGSGTDLEDTLRNSNERPCKSSSFNQDSGPCTITVRSLRTRPRKNYSLPHLARERRSLRLRRRVIDSYAGHSSGESSKMSVSSEEDIASACHKKSELQVHSNSLKRSPEEDIASKCEKTEESQLQNPPTVFNEAETECKPSTSIKPKLEWENIGPGSLAVKQVHLITEAKEIVHIEEEFTIENDYPANENKADSFLSSRNNLTSLTNSVLDSNVHQQRISAFPEKITQSVDAKAASRNQGICNVSKNIVQSSEKSTLTARQSIHSTERHINESICNKNTDKQLKTALSEMNASNINASTVISARENCGTLNSFVQNAKGSILTAAQNSSFNEGHTKESNERMGNVYQKNLHSYDHGKDSDTSSDDDLCVVYEDNPVVSVIDSPSKESHHSPERVENSVKDFPLQSSTHNGAHGNNIRQFSANRKVTPIVLQKQVTNSACSVPHSLTGSVQSSQAADQRPQGGGASPARSSFSVFERPACSPAPVCPGTSHPSAADGRREIATAFSAQLELQRMGRDSCSRDRKRGLQQLRPARGGLSLREFDWKYFPQLCSGSAQASGDQGAARRRTRVKFGDTVVFLKDRTITGDVGGRLTLQDMPDFTLPSSVEWRHLPPMV